VWAVVALDGGVFASASEDGSLRLWDTTSGAALATLPGSFPLRTVDARSTAASGHTFWLAAGDVAGRVKVWAVDEARTELVREFRAHEAAVRRVRFLADGTLATCGEDNQLRLWAPGSSKPLGARVHANFVTDVVDCGGVLLSCGYDGLIRAAPTR
jgi:WD40 repeat protein